MTATAIAEPTHEMRASLSEIEWEGVREGIEEFFYNDGQRFSFLDPQEIAEVLRETNKAIARVIRRRELAHRPDARISKALREAKAFTPAKALTVSALAERTGLSPEVVVAEISPFSNAGFVVLREPMAEIPECAKYYAERSRALVLARVARLESYLPSLRRDSRMARLVRGEIRDFTSNAICMFDKDQNGRISK